SSKPIIGNMNIPKVNFSDWNFSMPNINIPKMDFSSLDNFNIDLSGLGDFKIDLSGLDFDFDFNMDMSGLNEWLSNNGDSNIDIGHGSEVPITTTPLAEPINIKDLTEVLNFDSDSSKGNIITDDFNLPENLRSDLETFNPTQPSILDRLIIDDFSVGSELSNSLYKGAAISNDDLMSSALELQGKKNTAAGRAFQKHSTREGTAFTG
ncbi:hypothetical protein KPL40_05390, partial [Clostridium gasigenes]|uniref:hypothetical protein n=1 Tax=Clostridium gasigenes TaxID=94869 RepID=UPI001C0AF4B3